MNPQPISALVGTALRNDLGAPILLLMVLQEKKKVSGQMK